MTRLHGNLVPGVKFFHRHYLDPDMSGKPLQCKVTRVTKSAIYYRPYYGLHDDGTEWLGGAAWIAPDKFYTICSEDEIVGAK